MARSWMLARVSGLAFVLLASSAMAPGCGLESPPRSPLEQAREDAEGGDSDALGRLVLAELTSPGGSSKELREARKRLDGASGGGLDARLGAALDDDVHGRGVRAFEEWIAVLHAAHASKSPLAPLVALVAVEAASDLASVVARPARLDALKKLGPLVLASSAGTGLGWRAASSVSHLVAAAEEYGKPQKDIDAQRPKTIGCVTAIRLAGPFEFSPGDDDTSALEGERPGAWSAVFEGRPGAIARPRIVETERAGCTTAATKPIGREMYLAETFVTLDAVRELVLIPNDATRVTVDDYVVHLHDKTVWGGSLGDAIVLRLAPGRHRIVWRASEIAASLEIRDRNGATLALAADVDPTPGYVKTKPEVLDDEHPALLVSHQLDRDPLTAFLAARAALDAGAADVASVVLGDLLTPDNPAPLAESWPGPVVELAAQAAVRDPIWPAARATSRSKALFERAAEIDPELWFAPLVAVQLQGEGTPPAEKAKKLAALADKTPERPNAALELLDLYKQLGWSLEYDQLVAAVAKKFPDDPSVIRAHLRVLDEHGPLSAADALAVTLAENEPDEPVLAERYLARREFARAIKEYETFLVAHPERKSVVARLDDLKTALGSIDEATAKLAVDVAKGKASPMEQLDFLLAKGDKHAFETTIARAIQKTGARPPDVVRALELLQQTVDFAPFRLDARKVIAEHDETHKGKPNLGAAERILDYGALWIRSDGTSSFLEHEIVRVHSREAISELSRVVPKTGKALHLRVLKKDGRELEPVRVAGKPDLTFPDLDVGDVIETEVITAGAAPQSAYLAPRWFFAEPKIAYARSEYVVITPKGREVLIESRAGAPKPLVSTLAAFDVRRFRVDDAPPAPDEPEHRASAEEFLPNVTFGWGVKLEDAIARAAIALKETTPVDPRIVKRVAAIVSGVPANKTAERARRIYAWVTRNIQRGTENDGRRVVVGGSGDPAAAFRVLMRAAGMPTYIAVAHDRLAPPPISALSAGDGYNHTLLMIPTDEGDVFMSFGGRYLPFGYVPASARGEEAIVLRPGAPRAKVPVGGIVDGMRVEGLIDVAPNGDAQGLLTLSYEGIVGASIREEVEKLTEGELSAAIESGILAAALPNVQLKKVEVLAREEIDRPLGFKVLVDIPSFARSVGGGDLVVLAPFRRHLSGLAPRPMRLTPLLLDEADRRLLAIDVRLPENAKLERGPIKGTKTFGRNRAEASDALDGHVLHLRRVWDVDAARVEPAQYAAFRAFCTASDALADEETVIGF